MNWITVIYLSRGQTMVTPSIFDHTVDIDTPESEWSDEFKAEHYKIINEVLKHNQISTIKEMISVPLSKEIDCFFI